MKLIGLVMTVFLFAGCSSITYEEPDSGPLAKVRFTTDTRDAMVVRRYGDLECNDESEWMRLRQGLLFNSDPKSLGMPLGEDLHKNAHKEFYVKSNEELVFMFVGSITYGTSYERCGVPAKVRFETDKLYELHYTFLQNSCAVIFNEIVPANPNNFKRKHIETYSNDISGFGSGCVNAFNKFRLY